MAIWKFKSVDDDKYYWRIREGEEKSGDVLARSTNGWRKETERDDDLRSFQESIKKPPIISEGVAGEYPRYQPFKQIDKNGNYTGLWQWRYLRRAGDNALTSAGEYSNKALAEAAIAKVKKNM